MEDEEGSSGMPIHACAQILWTGLCEKCFGVSTASCASLSEHTSRDGIVLHGLSSHQPRGGTAMCRGVVFLNASIPTSA